MKKTILYYVWNGLIFLAILLALFNAYLEWYHDQLSQLLLIIVLLLIFLAASIKYILLKQNIN
ncbi:MAG: hypothetical protein K8R25_17930 [Methanosarcinales archaeon]|jgi:succinate dehydrogenase/fumarate reductase cytochrome b subunit|nr:hypothetical protein [Methanosarcinales archaeon]